MSSRLTEKSDLRNLAGLEGAKRYQGIRDVPLDVFEIARCGSNDENSNPSPPDVLLVRDIPVNRNENIESSFRQAQKLPVFFAA